MHRRASKGVSRQLCAQAPGKKGLAFERKADGASRGATTVSRARFDESSQRETMDARDAELEEEVR